MRLKIIALFATVLLAAPLRAKELPDDLEAVPTDALGFVHIRVADIWKSDSLKDVRETIHKAGEKALEGFDKRFLPHPSSIERLTVIVMPQDENLERQPVVFAILALNKAVDKAELLKSALPNAQKHEGGNRNFVVDERLGIAATFVSDKVIAFGQAPAIDRYCSRPVKTDGSLAKSLQMANSNRQITAAVNVGMIPPKMIESAPPTVQPLLKAKLLTLALDLSSNLQIDASLVYGNDDKAKDALEAIRALAAMGRVQLKSVRSEMLAKVLGNGKVAPLDQLPEAAMALFALGSIETVDELLGNPPITRMGSHLQATIKLPSGASGAVALSAVGVGLMLPAVQKVREAAARTQSMNNLKQIGLAMHNYHDTYNKFPSAAICDKNGKPLLSWRVAILPFIEQNNLYQQFKLDEPWDSEHNKPLADTLVKVYIDPLQSDQKSGLCHYRLFYGKEAMFDLKEGRTFANITDGTSNTFMVVEAAEGVPWTKPDDFQYDPKKPLPKFANWSGNGFLALFGDASVRFISNKTPEKTLRAYITANGGEVIDEDLGSPFSKKPLSVPKIPK